ncbi:MAG: peroxiredoxin-like family protein [Cypionkella sp.]
MLPPPTTIFPRQRVPSLLLPLTSGGEFDLSRMQAESFHLLVFYRGRHCPVCKTQLGALQAQASAFAERGVTVTAISCDTKDRAESAVVDWNLPDLRIAYDLTPEQARQWGLFMTATRGKTSLGLDEPALFSEPGLFLISPDLTLFFSSVQTMPFVRPPAEDMLAAIDYIKKNDYPPRGDVI